MSHALTFAIFLGSFIVGNAVSASIVCEEEEQVVLENGIAEVRLVRICHNSEATGVPAATGSSAPPTSSDLDTICVREALGQGLDPFEFCDIPAEDAEGIQLTPDMVAAAFARISLPPSRLVVQPPNGRTLVNFETNFYTEAEPLTRAVTLLGQRVQLEITPASFGWRFGDGAATSTSSPGAAYPDLEITHRYLRQGRVRPSVDTTYTATYRVNGGPSQPVPGSVTIPGPPASLQVVTASPQLVG